MFLSDWLSVACAALLCGSSFPVTVVADNAALAQLTDGRGYISKKGLQLYSRQDNSDVSTNNRSLALWNCSKLYDSSYGYNASSCKFVRENCEAKSHLINYLAFMKCDLPSEVTVRIHCYL